MSEPARAEYDDGIGNPHQDMGAAAEMEGGLSLADVKAGLGKAKEGVVSASRTVRDKALVPAGRGIASASRTVRDKALVPAGRGIASAATSAVKKGRQGVADFNISRREAAAEKSAAKTVQATQIAQLASASDKPLEDQKKAYEDSIKSLGESVEKTNAQIKDIVNNVPDSDPTLIRLRKRLVLFEARKAQLKTLLDNTEERIAKDEEAEEERQANAAEAAKLEAEIAEWEKKRALLEDAKKKPTDADRKAAVGLVLIANQSSEISETLKAPAGPTLAQRAKAAIAEKFGEGATAAKAAIAGIVSSFGEKSDQPRAPITDYPAADKILSLLDGATFKSAADFQAQALALYILTLQVYGKEAKPAAVQNAGAEPAAAVSAPAPAAAAPAPAEAEPVADAKPDAAPAPVAEKIQHAQILMEFANYTVRVNAVLPVVAYPESKAAWNMLYEAFRSSTVTVANVLNNAFDTVKSLLPTVTLSDPTPLGVEKQLADVAADWDTTAASLFPTRTRKFQEIYARDEKAIKDREDRGANEEMFEDEFLRDYDSENRKQQQEQALLTEVPRSLTRLRTMMPDSKSYGISPTGNLDGFTDAVVNPLNGLLESYDVKLAGPASDAGKAKTVADDAKKGGQGGEGAGTSELMPTLSALLAKARASTGAPAAAPGAAPGAPAAPGAAPVAITEAQGADFIRSLASDSFAYETLKTVILGEIKKTGMSPGDFGEFREDFDRELAEASDLSAHAIMAALQSAKLAFEASTADRADGAADAADAEASAAVAAEVAAAVQKADTMLSNLTDSSMDTDLGSLNLQLTSVLQAAAVAKLIKKEEDAAAAVQAAVASAAAKSDAGLADALASNRGELSAAISSALASALDPEIHMGEATKAALMAAMSTTVSQENLAGFQKQLTALSDNATAATAATEQATVAASAKIAELTEKEAALTEKEAAKDAALTSQYDRLSEVLSELQKTLTPAPAAPRGGAARGGAPDAPAPAAAAAAPGAASAPATTADTPATYREYRKALDQVKKDIRGVTDTLNGIQGSYAKFAENINYESDVRARNDALAANNEAKLNDSNNKITGIYSYLGEEGKAFVADVTAKLADKKKVLVSVQERVQKILDTQPTYKNYIDMSIRMKNAIEGDYMTAGSQGFLSQMDTMAGNLKTLYDNAFNEIKKIAVGIQDARKAREAELAAMRNQQTTGTVFNATVLQSQATEAKKTEIAKLEALVQTELSQYGIDREKAIKEADKLVAKSEEAAKKPAQPAAPEKDADDVVAAEPAVKAAPAAPDEAAAKADAAGKAKDEIIAMPEVNGLQDGFGAIKSMTGGDLNDLIKKHVALNSFYQQILDHRKVLSSKAVAVDAMLNNRSAADVAKVALAAATEGKAASADGEYKKLAVDIEDKLMREIVVVLDETYRRKLDPTFNVSSAASPAGEPGILGRIYNQYLDDKQNYNQNPVVAAMKLTESLRSNNMLPREVLKVSAMDKTVFIFVTLFIRLIALSITGYMVDRGTISRMQWALATFLMIYIFFFVAFVLLVNLDTYRLRIVFNYINFQANAGNVYAHLTSLVIFSLLIFIIMWNVNFPTPGMKLLAISDEEKAQLVYRLEVLTMIVWLFLTLIVVVT